MRVKILKAITYIMAIVFIMSVCMIDTDSYIIFVPLIISGGWLFLIYLANKDWLENFFD